MLLDKTVQAYKNKTQKTLIFLLISMTFNIFLGTAYYYKDILLRILNTLQL